jgi:hypothetical protein
MNMIKPKPLRRGDTIGLVGISGAIHEPETRFEKMLASIYALGYKVIIADSCREEYGYLSGTDVSRARGLNQMFRDDRVDAVVCMRGGYGAARILDQVDFDAIREASKKINRAYAGAAAAMGCRVYFEDQYNHAPRINDQNFRLAFYEVAKNFFPEEHLNFNKPWGAGCSDMGDISCIMPTVHPYVGGTQGTSHSASYYVVDAEKACVTGAKVQVGVANLLLSDDAAYAKKIIEKAHVPFDSVEKFFESVAELSYEGDGVIYNEDGTVTLRY